MNQSPLLEEQRENSGAMASNRFSYQVNWGVLKLVELHAKEPQYYLLMEQHEDALVCDDIDSPKYIELYQIKTRRGKNWKIAALTSLDASRSIVGKLYDARNNFKPIDVKMFFITDAYFEVKEVNVETLKILDSIRYSDLIDKDQLRLEKSIESCSPVDPADNLNDLFVFEKIPMTSDGHEIHAQGVLAEFFSVKLDKPFKKSSYYFIAGEVRKRNNVEKNIRDVDSLKKLKSISRADFDEWIVYCVQNTKLGDSVMENLKQELRTTTLSFTERKQIQRNASEYFLKIKGGDYALKRLSDMIVEAETLCSGDSILIYAHEVHNLIKNKIDYLNHYNEEFIISCILYELCR